MSGNKWQRKRVDAVPFDQRRRGEGKFKTESEWRERERARDRKKVKEKEERPGGGRAMVPVQSILLLSRMNGLEWVRRWAE